MAVAVLFDLEDTIVQASWTNDQNVLDFRHKTKEKLVELGIPPSILEGIERTTMMRNKSIEYVEKNLTKTEAERFYLEMEKFLRKYELDSAKKSKLFPETIQTLETLRKLGARIGLVTNTSIKAVNIVFHTHRLKDYFDVVVTRENVKKLKPDPEGILLAVKKLKVKNFFMVGDLDYDVIAAKSANASSIFVKRNSVEKTNLEADYIVQSLNEIITIIQSKQREYDDRDKES
jgi:HAD superfamily hydrolase (TIGR01549 family)